jgi:hypothetical protein
VKRIGLVHVLALLLNHIDSGSDKKGAICKSDRVFQDISGEWIISEEMKRFSEIAQTKRIDFIKARLIKRTSLGIWQPIPVTREEADYQKDESSLTKSQLLSVINALTPLLGDLERSRFRDLSSKSCDDLMNTL